MSWYCINCGLDWYEMEWFIFQSKILEKKLSIKMSDKEKHATGSRNIVRGVPTLTTIIFFFLMKEKRIQIPL